MCLQRNLGLSELRIIAVKWREMSKGTGESEAAVVAPVHIAGKDLSFPQIITDMMVEAVLRWLCSGKGFDRPPSLERDAWTKRSF